MPSGSDDKSFASSEMVGKLAIDLKAITKVLAKLNDFKSDQPGSSLAPVIAGLDTDTGKLAPVIAAWEAGLKKSPPALPKIKTYTTFRAAFTTHMGKVGKAAKLAEAEAKAIAGAKTVRVVGDAISEVLIKDKKMAQALIMVATGTSGRAGPKEDGIKEYRHIHIGGNANENLLFQPAKRLVLGVLKFHLDKEKSKSQKDSMKKVAARSGGEVTLKIIGTEISLA